MTTLLRLFASNWVGAEAKKPQLKVPSGHCPEKATRSGAVGPAVAPGSMKLSVSMNSRPSDAVVPSGHVNEVDHVAWARCSVNGVAAGAAAGTSSAAEATSAGVRGRSEGRMTNSFTGFQHSRPARPRATDFGRTTLLPATAVQPAQRRRARARLRVARPVARDGVAPQRRRGGDRGPGGVVVGEHLRGAERRV